MEEETPLLPSRPQITSLPGVKELLKKAWEIYKDRLGVILGINLIQILVMFAGIILFTVLGTVSVLLAKISPIFLLVTIAIVVIFFIAIIFSSIWGVIAILCVIKERDGKIGIKESFKMTKDKVFPYCWIAFLKGLVVTLGFLLLIIPGIVFGIWYGFSEYVFISEGLKGQKALSRSKQLVKGYWWGVFGRELVIGLIAMIVMMVFGFMVKFSKTPFIESIFSCLVSGFVLTCDVVIYESLKKLKEVQIQ